MEDLQDPARKSIHNATSARTSSAQSGHGGSTQGISWPNEGGLAPRNGRAIITPRTSRYFWLWTYGARHMQSKPHAWSLCNQRPYQVLSPPTTLLLRLHSTGVRTPARPASYRRPPGSFVATRPIERCPQEHRFDSGRQGSGKRLLDLLVWPYGRIASCAADSTSHPSKAGGARHSTLAHSHTPPRCSQDCSAAQGRGARAGAGLAGDRCGRWRAISPFSPSSSHRAAAADQSS